MSAPVLRHDARIRPCTLVRSGAKVAAIAASTLMSSPLLAQEPLQPRYTNPELRGVQATIRVYHGADKAQTQPFSFDRGDGTRTTIQRSFSWSMPRGSQVCIEVANANPVYYTYTVATTADSTSITPDLTEIASFITSALSKSAATSGAADWLQPYTANLSRLALDINQVQQAGKASELPESRAAVIGGQEEQNRGLAYAQSSLRAQPSSKGRFNDATLAETVQQWHAEATRSASGANGDGGNPTAEASVLLDALEAHGRTLVRMRDELRTTYLTASATWTDCQTVGEFPSTFALNIKRKGSAAEAKRGTGDALAAIHVTPQQPRPAIEIVPVVLTTFTSNVPEFSVVNGAISETRTDAFSARAGTLLVANVARWGPDLSSNLGFGIGVGLLGEKKVVSDYIPASLLLSLRDIVRLGIGVGWSERPHRLRGPAVVGQPLPADAGNLADLIETERRLSWFAVFTLSGFSYQVR
jgi:hypothetical protein